MTQQEVLKYLKRNKGKWFTTKEISKAIDLGTGSTNANLNKLFKDSTIYKKEIKIVGRPCIWRYKE